MMKRKILSLLLLLLTATGCYSNHHIIHSPKDSNQATFHRSGQMQDWQLTDAINRHSIEKVINLRGEKSQKIWFQKEKNICEKKGVEHVSVKLSAWRAPRKIEFLKLIDEIKAAENKQKNTIMHCYGGADRASFANAVMLIVLKDIPVDDALKESYRITYGHMCSGYCQPENVLKAYSPFQDIVPLRVWVKIMYNREDYFDE